MQLSTLAILACPACHTKLALTEASRDLETGVLTCSKCLKNYPLEKGIPRFVNLDELTGQNQRFARFYDWFSIFYAPGARLTYHLFGRHGRKRILSHLQPLSGRVLETSIGSGPNLPYFINSPSVDEIHGMDISAGQLAQCQHYAKRRGWQVELVQANAEELPYQDNTFDAIFHFGGINFFNNMKKAVDEMIRVVKPGGKVVFSDEGERIAKAYERTLPTFKRLFQEKRQEVYAPVDLVPNEMEDIKLEWILGGHIYIIEFRKPDIILAEVNQ